MKNKVRFIFTLILLVTGFYSCSLFEPASPTASYLRIDSLYLQTDYPLQGSDNSRITDVWVFYDKAYLGTFPLPATIPLAGEGNHEVSVRGGIIQNGISGSRAAYPKLVSFDTTMNLVAKDTVFLSPPLAYFSGVEFPQLEDFDDASLSLVSTNVDFAPLVITSNGDPGALEGNSGKVTLDANKPTFEVASSAAFGLPINTPVYLELNYKGDVDFSIGVFQTTGGGIIKSDLLSLRATSAWKKVYVTISELGGISTNALDYKIYLHAEKGSVLTSADLYFDNLKVLY
jgi:hypothetical protein